jgi:phenylacetate-CoA ligase
MRGLRFLQAYRLAQSLQEQKRFYTRDWTPESIRKWQLKQFNRQWRDMCQHVPYVRRLQQQHQLPPQFASWRQFQERVPVMERQTVQAYGDDMISRARTPWQWRSTGGSTAEPLRIPVWRSESVLASHDIWYGRSWFGITRADPLFLIWGHSHGLGQGISGLYHRVKRRLQDTMLGYYRWSAYDSSPPSLRQAARAMLAWQPAYLIAYATILDRFARVNHHLQPAFHQLGLKAAFATAESFPHNNSAQAIATTLGCPVAMEYGTVETGPIAQQRPDGRYTVFWRHYVMEGYKSDLLPGMYEIFLTSLFPRCMPLIRYKLGDFLAARPDAANCIREFDAVLGRSHDLVVLPQGAVIHSEALTHAIKDTPAIIGYQVAQPRPGDITLCYLAERRLTADEMAEIRRRLRRIHTELAQIRIERVEMLTQTRAGKMRCVLRHDPSRAPISHLVA